jgi:hypothetical protein
LEPLQPLLQKYIEFLDAEALPSTSESSRPRVQLKRADVWLGFKSLYVSLTHELHDFLCFHISDITPVNMLPVFAALGFLRRRLLKMESWRNTLSS